MVLPSGAHSTSDASEASGTAWVWPVPTSRTSRVASCELSASGSGVVIRATFRPSGDRAARWTWRAPSVRGENPPVRETSHARWLRQ